MLLGPYLVTMPASQTLSAASPRNRFDSSNRASSSWEVHTIPHMPDLAFARSTTSRTCNSARSLPAHEAERWHLGRRSRPNIITKARREKQVLHFLRTCHSAL